MKPGVAFSTADACLGILTEVVEGIIELRPRLAAVSVWGPSYFKWHEDKGWHYHFLAFRFLFDGWKKWCGAELVVPQALEGRIAWKWETTARLPGWDREHSRAHRIEAVVGEDGALDAAKMARLFVKDCRAMNVL